MNEMDVLLSVGEEDGLTGEREPARWDTTVGLVFILVLTAFLPAVGEDVILLPVPILGPGGVRRPEGEMGLADTLDRLEVELEGVDNMEVWPSGEVDLKEGFVMDW